MTIASDHRGAPGSAPNSQPCPAEWPIGRMATNSSSSQLRRSARKGKVPMGSQQSVVGKQIERRLILLKTIICTTNKLAAVEGKEGPLSKQTTPALSKLVAREGEGERERTLASSCLVGNYWASEKKFACVRPLRARGERQANARSARRMNKSAKWSASRRAKAKAPFTQSAHQRLGRALCCIAFLLAACKSVHVTNDTCLGLLV